MKRTSPLRRRRPGRRRSDRQYDAAFVAWVHSQPCNALRVPGHVCSGPIEADHMGTRPLGRRADDSTCAAMCQLGHRQRTDFSGPFRSFDKKQMRAFLDESIQLTRAAYALHLARAA